MAGICGETIKLSTDASVIIYSEAEKRRMASLSSSKLSLWHNKYY